MSFFSVVTSVVKSIGNAIVGTGSVLGGLFGDVIGRIIGIPGFIFDVIGIRFKKKLRLKFFILIDNGVQLIPQENIGETFKLAKRILDDQADIKLIQSGIIFASGAPEGALNVTSPGSSFLELWGEVGTYFNGLAGIGLFTRQLSVIIVNTMEEHTGRSFGPLANFILLEKSNFADTKNPTTTLAHEIGHSCDLLHRKQKKNLMYHNTERKEELTLWQSSVVRGSRFVWYL